MNKQAISNDNDNDKASNGKNACQNECVKHKMRIITSITAQKRKNKKHRRKTSEQLEHATVEGEASTTNNIGKMPRGSISNEFYDRIEQLTRIVNEASE